MADFILPDVGEGIAEGTLVKWLVKEGDKVTVDQDICEIETDKAVVDIPTPYAGTVSKLHWKEGDVVPVGKVLITVDDGSGSGNSGAAESSKEEKSVQETPSSDEKKPFFANTNQERSTPTATDSLAIIASPATRKLANEQGVDISTVKGSGPEGRILQQDVVGSPATSSSSAEMPVAEVQQPTPATTQPAGKVATVDTSKPVLAAPSTRRLAREMGIDIRLVHGTGAAGKVTDYDLKVYAEGPKSSTQVAPEPAAVQSSASEPKQAQQFTDGERVPLSGVRKAIAKHLSTAVHTMAQATHMETIDVQALFDLREVEKVRAKEMGVKLTYLPFFMKAIVGALKQFPQFNASIDEQTQELIMHAHVNVGVAVDTPDGLLVPVINDVAQKSILSLATEIIDVAGKARDRKLSPAQMQGSTISLSNVGVLGGDFFVPIVNYPNVAIVGIAKMKDSVLVVDGEAVITKTIGLCLSYDHRVVDGADAARFVNAIKERLEDPGFLLLEQ